jgi:protein phosphatase 1G
LSVPNRQKDTENGEGANVRYVAMGMQGWRRSMEDSHIAHIDLTPGSGVSLFGVFDGHGGQEVALYVKKHFAKELVKLASFKSKCYKEALEECFLKMDELMESKQGKEELAQFQKDSFSENAKSFAGCTATVILVTKTEIICANAGDSRTVLAKNGIAVELSQDHKPDDALELKRI